MFLRGTTLRGESKEVTAHHVVAHELAHIYLQSGDEVKVDAPAQTWLTGEAKSERKAEELSSARLVAAAH